MLMRAFCSCSFLAMVYQLLHLEALVVCNANELTGDFCKLDDHTSLQTIKLMTYKCKYKALNSVLRLWQLQELSIEVLDDTADDLEVVSPSPLPLKHSQVNIYIW